MNRLSSRDAWTAYAFDADILVQVPRQPRIIRELIAFPYDAESLLVVGAGSRKLLSGPFCKVLLRDLWPRLDGSADIEQLRADVPATGNLDEVLALLQRSDLIESGGEPPVAGIPGEVGAFLGRNVAIGGHFDSREQAAARLRGAVVVVLATEADAGILTERLLASGFGKVFAAGDSRSDQFAATHYLVVGDEAGLAERVAQIPKDSGATVLLSYVSGFGAAVGPLVLPSRSPCLTCSVRAITSNLQPGDPSSREFFLELAAQHLFGAVTHTQPNQLFSVSITHAEVDGQWSQRKISICRSPGCADCGLAGFAALADGSDEAAAWRTLNSTMLPPWELLSRRTHEGHYSAANAALTKKADDTFDGEALALAHSVETCVETLTNEEARRLDDLARTGLALQLAYGYVGHEAGGVRRSKKVAPTGGGLRSPEAYVYFRGVAGVANGIYRYTPQGHKLQCVEENLDLLRFESAVGTKLPAQCAVVIGIAGAKKLWPKYKTLSNRLSLLDAGVAQAYVHDACWALGVATHECTDWRSEALLQMLQLPTCRRYFDIGSVTVLGFGSQRRPSDVSDALDEEVFVGLGRSLGSAVRFGQDDLQRWQPTAANAFASYVETAVGRAAVRGFAPQPIGRQDCARLVQSFYARDGALRSCGAAKGHPRLMLINNIASPGFPSGMYAAHENGELTLQQPVTHSAQVVECFNQRSIGSAPIILVAAADIDALLRDQGAAGPAVGVTRAAGLLAHAWLAARVVGLEGCLAGGFIEPELRVRMGLDGYSCFPLFALALGVKA
jgi:SagB-type dehydrogenase family enzyme